MAREKIKEKMPPALRPKPDISKIPGYTLEFSMVGRGLPHHRRTLWRGGGNNLSQTSFDLAKSSKGTPMTAFTETFGSDKLIDISSPSGLRTLMPPKSPLVGRLLFSR